MAESKHPHKSPLEIWGTCCTEAGAAVQEINDTANQKTNHRANCAEQRATLSLNKGLIHVALYTVDAQHA